MVYDTFESQKNTKAASYTFLICGLLLCLFIFYKWRLQIPNIPIPQDLIEVNLGNDKEGLGGVQPLVKGETAPEQVVTSPRPNNKQQSEKQSSSEPIKADEDKNQEAAIINNKTTKKLQETKVVEVSKKLITVATPQVISIPAPPKLKVPLYKGGQGNGGNGTQEDNGFRNQGNKSGTGDAGSLGGKADSYGNSPGGRSGVSVIRGLSGRRPIHFPNMQDEFNETAKVYVDIMVDAAGSVVSASVARGTTTSNGTLTSIAIQKAKQLKFPVSSNEKESGTILFNFILKN